MASRLLARTWKLTALAALLAACTLPFPASPTPFTFPTPNLTHTAMYAGLATDTPPATTQPAVETSIPETPTVLVAATPSPSPTVVSLSSRPNGSPITAAYLASAPTIDGNLSEWTTTAYTANQAVFGAASWTGSNDLSATFYVGWDTGNLYVAAHVRDDRFVQVSTGRSLYKGDDVEIQLDANLASDYYTASLGSDDYQIGLSAGDFASRGPEAYRWYPVEGGLPGVTVQGRATADGYDIEARIPWSVFGVTPSGGSSYGFALSFSDDDLAGTAAQQSMVSSVGTRRFLNPTTWGTLILAPAAGS